MLKLNSDVYFHFFSEGMLVEYMGELTMLNSLQKEIIKEINQTGELEDVVDILNQRYKGLPTREIQKAIQKVVGRFKEKNWVLESYDAVVSKIHIFGYEGCYYPKKISIELTDRCHLSCNHCFKECGPWNRISISKDDLIQFLQEVKGKVAEVQITGGEPMLHPNFVEISKFVGSNFKRKELTTTAGFVNQNNISALKNYDYIQVSLYSDNADKHDAITNLKGSFYRTIKGIKLLVDSGIHCGVSNIVRKDLLMQIDDYIQFVADLGVDEVRFGILSILGRASNVDEEWRMGKSDIELCSDILHTLHAKYIEVLEVVEWSENGHSGMIADLFNTGLQCGAGMLSWEITETGIIKPCSFFSSRHFDWLNIKNYASYILVNQSDKILCGILEWERELNSVGLTTKNICHLIHRAIIRGGQNET